MNETIRCRLFFPHCQRCLLLFSRRAEMQNKKKNTLKYALQGMHAYTHTHTTSISLLQKHQDKALWQWGVMVWWKGRREKGAPLNYSVPPTVFHTYTYTHSHTHKHTHFGGSQRTFRAFFWGASARAAGVVCVVFSRESAENRKSLKPLMWVSGLIWSSDQAYCIPSHLFCGCNVVFICFLVAIQTLWCYQRLQNAMLFPPVLKF